jgi:hypothetical protein
MAYPDDKTMKKLLGVSPTLLRQLVADADQVGRMQRALGDSLIKQAIKDQQLISEHFRSLGPSWISDTAREISSVAKLISKSQLVVPRMLVELQGIRKLLGAHPADWVRAAGFTLPADLVKLTGCSVPSVAALARVTASELSSGNAESGALAEFAEKLEAASTEGSDSERLDRLEAALTALEGRAKSMMPSFVAVVTFLQLVVSVVSYADQLVDPAHQSASEQESLARLHATASHCVAAVDPGSAAPAERLLVMRCATELRSGPSIDSPVVGNLIEGEIVQLIREQGDWREVEYFDFERLLPDSAWVPADSLRFESASGAGG